MSAADDQDALPAYQMHNCSGLAEAADLLAAEARAYQKHIKRHFNGAIMRAGPGATGARVVIDWSYDFWCRRETQQREALCTLRARAEAAETRAGAAETRAEAAEAEVDRLRAELAQVRAEGETAGRTAERAAVVAMLRGGAHSHRGFGVSLIAGELERYADTIGAGAHVGAAGAAR